jgi:hypothetical protein
MGMKVNNILLANSCAILCEKGCPIFGFKLEDTKPNCLKDKIFMRYRL